MSISTFLLFALCCVSLRGAQSQHYQTNSQAQATKAVPLMYYKQVQKDVSKAVTTAEPSTESNQDSGNSQFYVGDNRYYTDYKQQKYSPDYGYDSSTTSAPVYSPPVPSDKTIQGHLDSLVKLLLTSKGNTPKFLLLLPLNGKALKSGSYDATTNQPTTVKPKPRKGKTKYIVV